MSWDPAWRRWDKAADSLPLPRARAVSAYVEDPDSYVTPRRAALVRLDVESSQMPAPATTAAPDVTGCARSGCAGVRCFLPARHCRRQATL